MTTTLVRNVASFVLANGAAGCFALFTLDGYEEPLVGAPPGGDGGAPMMLDGGAVGSSSSSSSSGVVPITGDAGPDADAAVPVAGKLMFVTSDVFEVGAGAPVGFSSVNAANDTCKRVASAAGLPGQYRAWLTDDQGSAPGYPGRTDDAVAKSTEPFVTVDHRLIASTYAELRKTGPRVAISTTELGAVLPETPPVNGERGCPQSGIVWTGARPLNEPPTSFDSMCANWSRAGSDQGAGAGRITGDSKEWEYTCALACSGKARLYCFQE